MGLSVSLDIALFYALGLAILYGVGWLLLVPQRIMTRFLINGLLGGAAAVLINLIGAQYGIAVPLNPASAIAAGFLGVPGVIMIAILNSVL